MKDILKCAALGLAVGAGIVTGMYAGSKLMEVGTDGVDALKKKFSSDKPAAVATATK